MNPLPGAKVFEALKDEDCIVMAANPRINKGVLNGIFKAAKETDAALVMELAKSESDLSGGYTGLTPQKFSENCRAAAEETGFDCWVLHADHLTVKKKEDVPAVKELIGAQISAGYTSFAIDASFLFNESGADEREQLAENIAVTTELARFIESKAAKGFGLEVEVGEIGKKDAEGFVKTTLKEATAFLTALKENGVEPNLLAIANGSAHGNTFVDGKLVEQVSIDVSQTKAVAKALRDAGFAARIAQHGITGTPLHLIQSVFPKKDILKGNVGTHWMNLAWNVFKEREKDLYEKIRSWTLAEYGEKARAKGAKSDEEVFGKNSKLSIKHFFDEIYAVGGETETELEKKAFGEAKKFFKAFNAVGSASIVRKSL